MTTHLAIKTGHRFTLVTVDAARNECRVFIDHRIMSGVTSLCVSGTGEGSIKQAATDCAGASFRTLRALRDDASEALIEDVVRRCDLDC